MRACVCGGRRLRQCLAVKTKKVFLTRRHWVRYGYGDGQMWDATPRAAAFSPGAHGSPSEPTTRSHPPSTPHPHPTLWPDLQRPWAGFSSTLPGKTTTRQGLKPFQHAKVPAHRRGTLALSLTVSEIWPIFLLKNAHSFYSAAIQPQIWKCFFYAALPKFCMQKASTHC